MYKVIWLKEGQELATFKGEIIQILDKRFSSDDIENCSWKFQCLVKINSEEEPYDSI